MSTPSSDRREADVATSCERVGVYVDCANLYYSARNCFGSTVDYRVLKKELVDGRHLRVARAYLPVRNNTKQGFQAALKRLGYSVHTIPVVPTSQSQPEETFHTGDGDVELVTDILTDVHEENIGTVAIGSGDGDFSYPASQLSERGVRVEVAAFPEALSDALRDVAAQIHNLADQRFLYK